MKKGIGERDISNYNRANAMTPLNWMCGISEFILLPTSTYNYTNWLGVGFFIIFIAILIFYGFMYHHFAKNDPNRLQSEEYNLESQKLAFAYDENRGIEVKESFSRVVSASQSNNGD